MWKCMAPTGAFGEIYRPRDSDRRSLFFMLSGLKKRKERGLGCGSGARGRRCACSPPGLDVVLMRLGGACQALLTKVAFKGFNPLEKKGARMCCTYIRTCESGKWFLGKKHGHSFTHLSDILLGRQVHNIPSWVSMRKWTLFLMSKGSLSLSFNWRTLYIIVFHIYLIRRKWINGTSHQ